MEQELVFKNGEGQALTNSLLVAKKFGKKHKHVMEAIHKILKSAENSAVLQMYVESTYLSDQNKQIPMYVMNRDGFTLLAMGFTGKEAIGFKVEFINAFNKMEATLKNGIMAQPKTASEMFLMQAQINVEQERRINAIEQRLDTIESEREENARLLLETKVSDNSVTAMTLRKSIIALVNEYSAATNTKQQDVWHTIYKDLYYKYNKSINSYTKLFTRETKLDIAERKGLLQPIFDIISDMIVKWRESQ